MNAHNSYDPVVYSNRVFVLSLRSCSAPTNSGQITGITESCQPELVEGIVLSVLNWDNGIKR